MIVADGDHIPNGDSSWRMVHREPIKLAKHQLGIDQGEVRGADQELFGDRPQAGVRPSRRGQEWQTPRVRSKLINFALNIIGDSIPEYKIIGGTDGKKQLSKY